ncbi:glutamate receptor U1-like [Centruroides vittatus]|uniref:glutamate receptor U1-like n=1 Tax=Centruroides vittatus TaxID=120091 RepID=UPI00350F1C1D
MKIAAVELPEFLEQNPENKSSFRGRDIKLLKFILQYLGNFTFEILQPVETVWGTQLQNGSWIGVVGKLHRKEADMGLPRFYISYERVKAIDFTIPFDVDHVRFIISAPDALPRYSILAIPFSIHIWISGDIEKVKNIPIRFVISIWLLIIIVLGSAYSGLLFSLMTNPPIENVPTTFEELINSIQNGEYSCGVMNSSIINTYLMKGTEKKIKFFGDYLKKNPDRLYFNHKDAMENCLNEKFAFISSSDFIRMYQRRYGKHRYLISKDSFATFNVAIPLRKRLPAKESINEMQNNKSIRNWAT